MKDYDSIIVHYDEIGLKGANRSSFEQLLIHNIQKKIGKLKFIRETGQITFELGAHTPENVKNALLAISGIASVAFAKPCSHNKEDIAKTALKLIAGKTFSSFKVDTRRHDKTIKSTSIEMNTWLGEKIVKATHAKVDLRNPELTFKLELTKNNAYCSLEEYQGIGGLPTNRQQKVVALLSGGFDSPVAAYMLMKRGCEVILVHFWNKNQMSTAVRDKIERIAERLHNYQLYTKLYLIPFEQLQMEIIKNVKPELRMLVYRKCMLTISSQIASEEEASFLVVGDSLSQVASQTLSNLVSTYSKSPYPIFTPLIGMNKNEIMGLARKIGTGPISEEAYGDCCSYFLAKHPALETIAEKLDLVMKDLNLNTFSHQAIKEAIIKIWK